MQIKFLILTSISCFHYIFTLPSVHFMDLTFYYSKIITFVHAEFISRVLIQLKEKNSLHLRSFESRERCSRCLSSLNARSLADSCIGVTPVSMSLSSI